MPKLVKHLKHIVQKTLINFLFSGDTSERFIHKDVPLSKEIAHEKWIDYILNLADKEGFRVLEIGSRAVVYEGFKKKFKHAQYVGFDIYPGENVDVIGDIHKLSSYFDEKFDFIFSTAVFEHLAMPWVAAEEIVKCLKTGGYVFLETHYSYSSHERPWHFFQFSENALKVLFNPALGIETVMAGCSNPIIGYFAPQASKYLQGSAVTGLYCHSEFLGKKIKEIDDFSWNKLELKDIVGESFYPKENLENF